MHFTARSPQQRACDQRTLPTSVVAFTFRIDDRMLEATAPTNVCLNVYEPCVWTFRISGDQLIRENGAAPEYREVYTRVGPPLR